MTTADFDSKTASEIIAGFDRRPEMLVQILHAFMKRFGHVDEQAIRQLARELNLSRADVHGVVSFYHDFKTSPSGKHVIKVCQAEACQAMGSRELAAHANSAASADIAIEPVYCLGNCACSPAIMVDGKTYGRIDAERFDTIVAGLAEPG